MSIHLNAEAYAGASIADVCDDLCALANRTRCHIHCGFNGVTLIVRPGDDPRRLERAWDQAFRSKVGPKVTTADRADA